MCKGAWINPSEDVLYKCRPTTRHDSMWNACNHCDHRNYHSENAIRKYESVSRIIYVSNWVPSISVHMRSISVQFLKQICKWTRQFIYIIIHPIVDRFFIIHKWIPIQAEQHLRTCKCTLSEHIWNRTWQRLN